MSFTHLHLHSQYSLLDGFVAFDRLIERLQKLNMTAVGLTDHGNMFGAVEFFKRAKQADVKPLIGCEVYITTDSRFDKNRNRKNTHHLTLLVKNKTGFENLSRLVTAGYFEGFYYKPRIDFEILKQYSEGLICASGCLAAEIPALVASGMEDQARQRIMDYRQIFADGDFYLELQNHGLQQQQKVNQFLTEVAHDLSLPLVATNDCHYVEQGDSSTHDIMLCIQSGKMVDDPSRLRFDNDQFYVKSAEEMQELFPDQPEALANTQAIADKIHFEFEFGKYHFPSFALPAGKTLDQQLIEQSKQGLEKRFAQIFKQESVDSEEKKQALLATYNQRLEFELGVIQKMGFSGYFLIVADFIAFAKQQDIPVGPGRGSAAGSLVAFALEITDVDPIPYKLLFERFLNPERISMPDIDIDFCVRGRDRVIEYVSKKYSGEGDSILQAKVAQIITFGKMKARAVIRDVGRVINMSYGEVDRIAKMVPFAVNMTLESAFEQEPKFEEMRRDSRQIEELLSTAESLEGFVRHASTHAAGVVISDDRPLCEHMPLFRGSEGEVTTQFDMKMVEELGLIKFDFLGLKTLTVLKRAAELVKRNHNVEVDLGALPLDEPRVYEMLSKGNTTGIFQLESSGMRDLIVKLKPGAFEEIIALVALYRPGPLGSGMVDDFIKRKHGLIPIAYELSELEDILKETYGVILYQEQVMQIAVKLADYSMADADILRKAMGKKIPEVLEKQREKFMGGALKNNVPTAKAERIFDLIVQFGGYGFNKSHSTAYALISYQTAYLKALYPVEFMTALLCEDLHNTDKVISYIANCRAMDIEVNLPSVNTSGWDFEAAGKQINFGLGAVKNVGEGAVEAIVEARAKDGKFKDIFDFAKRVDLNRANRKVFEGLIKCGALDLGVERSKMFAVVDRVIEYGHRQQEQEAIGQVGLFESSTDDSVPRNFFPQVDEWDDKVRLNYEKESVGFYLTGHPLSKYEGLMTRLCCKPIDHFKELPDKETVLMGCVATTTKEITTKTGKRMAFVTLEDLTGSLEGVVFSDVYLQSVDLLRSGEPLCVRGSLDQGEEQSKILVNQIALLTEAEKDMGLKVHVSFDKQRVSQQQLIGMQDVMRRFHGDCATHLHITLEDGRTVTLDLPKECWVAPGEDFAKQLEKTAGGPGSIKIEIR